MWFGATAWPLAIRQLTWNLWRGKLSQIFQELEKNDAILIWRFFSFLFEESTRMRAKRASECFLSLQKFTIPTRVRSVRPHNLCWLVLSCISGKHLVQKCKNKIWFSMGDCRRNLPLHGSARVRTSASKRNAFHVIMGSDADSGTKVSWNLF